MLVISVHLFEAIHDCTMQWLHLIMHSSINKIAFWPSIHNMGIFIHKILIFCNLKFIYKFHKFSAIFTPAPQGIILHTLFWSHWSSRRSFTKKHLLKRFQKTSHIQMKIDLTRHLFPKDLSVFPQFLHRNTDPTKIFLGCTHKQRQCSPDHQN